MDCPIGVRPKKNSMKPLFNRETLSPLTTSIGTRLTVAVLIVSGLLSILIVLGVALHKWHIERQRMETTVQLIGQAHLPRLTADIWDYSPRLHTNLEDILRLPHVSAATLSTPGKRVEVGSPPPIGSQIRSFPILHLPSSTDLGQLDVVFDVQGIRDSAAHDARWLLLALILPVIATAFTVLILFRFMAGRHLDNLATYAQSLSIDTLDADFQLHRRHHPGDELDRLANAFSVMRHNLRVEIQRRCNLEGELAESQDRYREVFDATGDALFIHDAQTGRILEANRSASQLYRRTLEDFRQIDLETLSQGTPPYDHLNAKSRMMMAVQDGPQLFEWRARDSTGATFWVEVFLKHVMLGTSSLIIAAVRDVDARKQAEESVRHLQRMETLGELASGIAHDFNNMLMGVQGGVELAADQLTPDHPAQPFLDIALQATLRAGDLTRKLLSFSHRNRQEISIVDIHASIQSACGFLERAIHRGIRVQCHLHSDFPFIRADASDIQNALLNLGINARDAIGESGVITFSTTQVLLDETSCKEWTGFQVAPGPFIQVSVTDNGSGIPPHILSRIFEPFFTTKPVGKGTGLGLASVFATVTAAHGAIRVTSQLGEGTCFTLLLPQSGEAACKDLGNGINQLPPYKGRILIVDDEPLALQAACGVVERLGGHAMGLNNADAACTILRDSSQIVDVVLLDLIMPGLCGADAFRALRAIRPGLPIVLCSGFSRDATVDSLLQQPKTCFLQKPYTITELGTLLHSLSSASVG